MDLASIIQRATTGEQTVGGKVDNTLWMRSAQQTTPSALDPLKFVLAGNAIFTIQSVKTGLRFTYKVSRPRPSVDNPEPKHYYVGVLSGPENLTDYSLIGFIRDNTFKHAHSSTVSITAKSFVAFKWFFNRLVNDKPLDGITFMHAGRCGRCGRTLTVPESIITGFGPECAGRM